MIPISLIDADLSQVRPEKIEEVKSSVQELGTILHPITLRSNGNRYQLVAGKVRLAAYISLGRTEIPASLVDSQSRGDEEISLHENLKRSNLEWWEQIELERQLHDLRTSQFGKKRTGRDASKTSGWSQTDTARELGIALGAFSQDLMLANAIHRNPHLKKIKDKTTAIKLVREAAKREHIEEETLIPASFEMNQVFLGDSLEVLKELPQDTFNVCITDPPWVSYKDMEHLESDENTLPIFREIYRVLRRDTLLYAFVSTPDWYMYQKELPKFGFVMQDHPIIWYKPGRSTLGSRAWEYKRDYEMILLAAKGSPVLTTGTNWVMTAVLTYSGVQSLKMIHPHEKPVELIKELIRHSTFDEAKILDPFAGSGSVLAAAKEMSRKYIGIERNHEYYLKIKERLENAEDNDRIDPA